MNAKANVGSKIPKPKKHTTKTKPKEGVKKMGITTNFLVIAPHHHKDEDYADAIAERMQKDLGCHSVTNTKYRRSKVNLNDIDEIEKHPKAKAKFFSEILDAKDAITKNYGKAFVVLIHGMAVKTSTFSLELARGTQTDSLSISRSLMN